MALWELYAEEKIEIRVSREKVKMPEYTVLLYRNSYSDEIGLIGRLCVFVTEARITFAKNLSAL